MNGTNIFVSKNLQNQSSVSSDVIHTSELFVNGVAITGGGGGNNYDTAEQIAIGKQAGVAQGVLSIAIGNEAGNGSQGSQAIAIGNQCAIQDQGFEAIAVGAQAGCYNQGQLAVSLGLRAGFTGQKDLANAIGYFAGYTSQGTQGVAIGYKCAEGTQGQYSVAIGQRAGQNTQGQNSVAIGNQAGRNGQGDYSVAIGYISGGDNQGDYSVALGYGTSAHDQCLVLNGTSTALASTVPSQTIIRPIREINGTTVLATLATQNLLVYDTSSFEVKSCKNLEMEGTILANSFLTSSDRRLKKNIEPFPSVLEHIKNTHPVKFQWKKDDRHDYGFIAQEFYREFDFLKDAHNWEGEEERDKFYSMEYPKITAILFKAVQELNEKVELLTKKNI